MSAVDEQEQAGAIRRALSLPDDAEVTRDPDGWRIRVPAITAELALSIDRRVRAATDVGAWAREPDEPLFPTPQLDRTLVGGVAEREQYVTARAEQLARAFDDAVRRVRTPRLTLNGAILAFRDLIDRGVLK
jgi:hypothetical protein